jgi:large subunit ribosomal protein L11
VIITVYNDKSFEFILKHTPVAVSLLEITKVKAGSKESNRLKVGNVSWDQIRTVAEGKMPDMNCFTIESAMSMVAGTARSLGLTITGESPLKK